MPRRSASGAYHHAVAGDPEHGRHGCVSERREADLREPWCERQNAGDAAGRALFRGRSEIASDGGGYDRGVDGEAGLGHLPPREGEVSYSFIAFAKCATRLPM